jgi:peptidoglycan/xylan/chitin deacetylase (PgdA/CDA1 family)
LKSLRQKFERRFARLAAARRVSLDGKSGVVTFSFDDVPQSACRKGRDTLERYEARGTYYVCGGLTGERSSTEPFHDEDDLKSLMRAGHEIGSHGYKHVNYQQIPIDQLSEDIRRNCEFFDALGCETDPTSFAYPYGCVSPKVKRVCGARFASSRGILGGVNTGSVDLGLVKAVPFYSRGLTPDEVLGMIARAEREKGWLVFFTHSVVAAPDEFGCTPELLDFAVSKATESQCGVLTMSEALAHFSIST